MVNNHQSNGVISFRFFLALLGSVFITLKLCKVITWSWLWVLAPFWMPFTIGILLAIGAIWLAYINRPKTPEEKVAKAARRMADAIKNMR